jgi:hypothetical protein
MMRPESSRRRANDGNTTAEMTEAGVYARFGFRHSFIIRASSLAEARPSHACAYPPALAAHYSRRFSRN